MARCGGWSMVTNEYEGEEHRLEHSVAFFVNELLCRADILHDLITALELVKSRMARGTVRLRSVPRVRRRG